jgi:hypothetical protein
MGLACFALTAALAAVPANATTCGRDAATRAGRWYTATPPFPDMPPAYQAMYGVKGGVSAVAVDPANPRAVFVADGAHLLRSDDGGCSWTKVYALPDAPGISTPDGDVGQIRSIDVAHVAGRSRVLLAVQGVGGAALQPVRTVVVRSDDGYTGWAAVTDPTFVGAYTNGPPWTPQVRSAGGITYAAVPSPAGTVAYLRSADGGQTWSLRTPPAATSPVTMTSFAVNPWHPDELWEWGAGTTLQGDPTTGLRRSTDGGASWSWLDPWPFYESKPGWWNADVVWPRKDAPARVLVLGEAGDGGQHRSPVAAWSGDGGRSFQLSVPPNTYATLYDAAVTHLPNGDAIVVAFNRTAYRIVARNHPPVRADWRTVPKPPKQALVSTGITAAGATHAAYGVVAAPTALTVQLLAVR